MKKLFKYFIPFFLAAVFVLHAEAITVQGTDGVTIHGGSGKFQGDTSFSPLDYGANLIIWADNSSSTAVTLFADVAETQPVRKPSKRPPRRMLLPRDLPIVRFHAAIVPKRASRFKRNWPS